jgi:hypothetical protein
MPRNNGQNGVGQFAINHMQVCAAYAAGQYLHPDFTRAGRGVGQFFPLQWCMVSVKAHGEHGGIS